MLSCDVKIRLDSQLSRMNCQMFSTGLSSGHLGGNGTMLIFLGTSSFPVVNRQGTGDRVEDARLRRGGMPEFFEASRSYVDGPH